MKLGEALILRADIQTRVNRLRERLTASMVVQEGERPPEDPQTLFGELNRLVAQFEDLVARINRTNLTTQVSSGGTLTDALARRDALKLHMNVLQGAADITKYSVRRYGRAEIRIVSTVDVAAIRRQIDALAQMHRELDTTIQATNWARELVESAG